MGLRERAAAIVATTLALAACTGPGLEPPFDESDRGFGNGASAGTSVPGSAGVPLAGSAGSFGTAGAGGMAGAPSAGFGNPSSTAGTPSAATGGTGPVSGAGGQAGAAGGDSTAGAGAASGGSGGSAEVDASVPDAGVGDASLDAMVSDAVECAPSKVTCDAALPSCNEGQVPSVVEGCYGVCVPIERCACAAPEDCPEPERYTCHNFSQRCGPYL